MSRFARFFGAISCVLAFSVPALAQKEEELVPGHTFPKDGYFPDEKKVVYVVIYHHKKRVEEFGFQDYFMNADGVNNTTADKMKKAFEERYPNLVVYVKETNERDVQTLVERERKRIKFIDKDWVDVQQPKKIEMPKKKVVDGVMQVSFDDDAPKGGLQGLAALKQLVAEFNSDVAAFKRDNAAWHRDAAAYDRDEAPYRKIEAAYNADVAEFNALPQRTQAEADRLKRRRDKLLEDKAALSERYADMKARLADLKKREADLDKRRADLDKRKAALTDR